MKQLFKFFTSLPRRINDRIRSRIEPTLLGWKVTLGFMWRGKAKPHSLPSPLIVSLTSYPARFSKLPLTLKCLLAQSMSADRIILWIAHQDKIALTPSILALQKEGLEIAYCDDLRSYKKIIPTLQNYPDSFIVTADDDVYYWPTWLEELVNSYQMGGDSVICHRVHRTRLGGDGFLLPYEKWEFDSQSTDASSLNFQTGVGGVLYPPNAFHADVMNSEMFMNLCPLADDIWLYWMMRLNGMMARKATESRAICCWADTQQTAIFHNNVAGGGNSKSITAMVGAFGFPFESLNKRER